jgi:hypothetical protein
MDAREPSGSRSLALPDPDVVGHLVQHRITESYRFSAPQKLARLLDDTADRPSRDD